MPIETIREIRGTGLPLRGDNIDTDRIMPARFLRSVSFEGLEHHLFEDDIRQAEAQAPGRHPFASDRFADATVLVVNKNFGCGSSREHAPQAIRRRGFLAVAGESFSEIFFANAVALGLPCVMLAGRDTTRLQDAIERTPALLLAIDLERLNLRAGDDQFHISLPAPAREAFLQGTWDAAGLLLDRYDEVVAVARRLAYINGWSG